MGENSKIEWTTHTFNPWIGCTKVADGCTHCWAEALTKRTGLAKWGASGTRTRTSEDNWKKPLAWNRKAAELGVRRKVFTAPLADVFEDWQGPILGVNGRAAGGQQRRMTMDDLRRELFALIDATPHLDWLLLTKRPENVRRMCPSVLSQAAARLNMADHDAGRLPGHPREYRRNVWLLTSIATQADADKNIPELLACRDLVPVLGVSAEPLLGPLALGPRLFFCLDWLIVGGESGPHARPMHPNWARSIRDQCQAAGVPFFFKQWGEWAPLEVCAEPAAAWKPCGVDETHSFADREPVFRIGKKAAGRLLDGREWNEFPQAVCQAANVAREVTE